MLSSPGRCSEGRADAGGSRAALGGSVRRRVHRAERRRLAGKRRFLAPRASRPRCELRARGRLQRRGEPSLDHRVGRAGPRFRGHVNETALARLRVAQPHVNSVAATARSLPFRDRWFDLVFTTGVLIHVPPGTLSSVMGEVVRCSDRYVLCAEYFSEQPTTVPCRGQTQALFKRDFGALYQELSRNSNRSTAASLVATRVGTTSRGGSSSDLDRLGPTT